MHILMDLQRSEDTALVKAATRDRWGSVGPSLGRLGIRSGHLESSLGQFAANFGTPSRCEETGITLPRLPKAVVH
eukprot:9485577-Pyramimonas_sp.AAC.1